MDEALDSFLSYIQTNLTLYALRTYNWCSNLYETSCETAQKCMKAIYDVNTPDIYMYFGNEPPYKGKAGWNMPIEYRDLPIWSYSPQTKQFIQHTYGFSKTVLHKKRYDVLSAEMRVGAIVQEDITEFCMDISVLTSEDIYPPFYMVVSAYLLEKGVHFSQSLASKTILILTNSDGDTFMLKDLSRAFHAWKDLRENPSSFASEEKEKEDLKTGI